MLSRHQAQDLQKLHYVPLSKALCYPNLQGPSLRSLPKGPSIHQVTRLRDVVTSSGLQIALNPYKSTYGQMATSLELGALVSNGTPTPHEAIPVTS